MLDDINFKKQPYNGVLTRVAKKNGVSSDAVTKSISRGSIKYLDDINNELLIIKNKIDKFNKLVRTINEGE